MEKITKLSRGEKILGAFFILALILILTLLVFKIAYAGRIYPGVTANGVYLGGLTLEQAQKELNSQTANYAITTHEIITPSGTISLSANDIGVIYKNQDAVNQAMMIGRSGWIGTQFSSQFASLVGLAPQINSVYFDTNKLSKNLVDINNLSAKQSINAKFVATDGKVVIENSQRGKRIDFASSSSVIADYYGQMRDKTFILPVINVDPQLSGQALEKQKNIIEPYLSQPLKITYDKKEWNIDANTIVSWLTLPSSNQPIKTDQYQNYYNLQIVKNNLSFDKKSISSFVNGLSRVINVEPINARLTISEGKATVFTQSRDGKTLDVEKSTESIFDHLVHSNTQPITLAVNVTKAEVSDDNIDKLGIKELISEGVSYFPGSSANRIQNVRVGSSKFNGVLIKPGEVFSFNKYLGEVSAATGYAEGIVILENKEEKQYGGGLCQVSSTAYRAALLAGLPIVSRTNHAFAVSYYTQPFGVPGVDATIYLPYPDMKFLNDTGKYILIQTEIVGTTLKFRFYGTKTKMGVIRGPYFISGSNDYTKPSQTVFYRDVVDLNGKVIKTDTTTTTYKSSLEFPLIN